MAHDGPFDDLVRTDDGDLGSIDHRRGGNTAQNAKAGQGDGRAGQFLAACLALASQTRQPRDFGRQLPQVLGLGMAHHRHNQALVGLGGYTHMQRLVAAHDARLVVIEGVHLWELWRNPDQATDQERQYAELWFAFCGLIQVRAQGLELGDVHFFDVGIMRDMPLGLLHLLGDATAKADDPDLLYRRMQGRRADTAGAADQQPVEIGMLDASTGTVPLDHGKVDAKRVGPRPNGRRGQSLAGLGGLGQRGRRRRRGQIARAEILAKFLFVIGGLKRGRCRRMGCGRLYRLRI